MTECSLAPLAAMPRRRRSNHPGGWTCLATDRRRTAPGPTPPLSDSGSRSTAPSARTAPTPGRGRRVKPVPAGSPSWCGATTRTAASAPGASGRPCARRRDASERTASAPGRHPRSFRYPASRCGRASRLTLRMARVFTLHNGKPATFPAYCFAQGRRACPGRCLHRRLLAPFRRRVRGHLHGRPSTPRRTTRDRVTKRRAGQTPPDRPEPRCSPAIAGSMPRPSSSLAVRPPSSPYTPPASSGPPPADIAPPPSLKDPSEPPLDTIIG